MRLQQLAPIQRTHQQVAVAKLPDSSSFSRLIAAYPTALATKLARCFSPFLIQSGLVITLADGLDDWIQHNYPSSFEQKKSDDHCPHMLEVQPEQPSRLNLSKFILEPWQDPDVGFSPQLIAGVRIGVNHLLALSPLWPTQHADQVLDQPLSMETGQWFGADDNPSIVAEGGWIEEADWIWWWWLLTALLVSQTVCACPILVTVSQQLLMHQPQILVYSWH